MEQNLPKDTSVSVLGHVVLASNNDRQIRLYQHEIDGPIEVRVTTPVTKFDVHMRKTEAHYEIAPGDFVTMLNWYRCQKNNGNEYLNFE